MEKSIIDESHPQFAGMYSGLLSPKETGWRFSANNPSPNESDNHSNDGTEHGEPEPDGTSYRSVRFHALSVMRCELLWRQRLRKISSST